MPKSKSRNKSALRRQEILSTPRRVFKELYFTKSSLAKLEELGEREDLTVKEIAQTAPKTRYVIDPNSVLYRKPLEGGKPGTGRTRTILHFRH